MEISDKIEVDFTEHIDWFAWVKEDPNNTRIVTQRYGARESFQATYFTYKTLEKFVEENEQRPFNLLVSNILNKSKEVTINKYGPFLRHCNECSGKAIHIFKDDTVICEYCGEGNDKARFEYCDDCKDMNIIIDGQFQEQECIGCEYENVI